MRGLRLAVLLALAGSALVLGGLALPWAHYELGHQLFLTGIRHTVTGSAIRPDLRAAAFVGLAGVAALVATRSWARAAVGVLLAVMGAYIAVRGAVQLTTTARTFVLDDFARHGGCPASAQCASELQIRGAPRAGELTCVLGGLLLAASGALTVTRGRAWAGLGSSYEVPGGPPEEPVTDKGVWDALDRGDDPTG